ncbi:hypothetical protein X848_gp18 [Edwardsiella phage PEi21]|uniref:Uncharacterized protein n=1 Tax=Edwardsiella phage PEi21 TaxID=1325372 RepID=N0DSB2_9CAUD|nr:hypothetical protein X848_gp18 [Edwardsiella phage PEi21]BAN16828.1 hypothetical protein [Edwardsiella phage PEi21]
MSVTFDVLNGPNGDSVCIDVTYDGDHYTTVRSMTSEWGQAIVYFAFFSDAACTDQVTPTGGTITVTGAPWYETYLEPSNGNGVIQASTVSIGKGTYTPPTFVGMLLTVKVDVAGITGANYMRATVWRR